MTQRLFFQPSGEQPDRRDDSKIYLNDLVAWSASMASAKATRMSKVDRERADVLRTELARLCWLAMHDDADAELAGRLLHQELMRARSTATRAAVVMDGSRLETFK